MCGRYQVDFEDVSEALAQELGLAPMPEWIAEARDIRPAECAPVLLDAGDGVRLKNIKWGFEREDGGLVINARVESLSGRAMFRGLEARQRCAMPATRYYEWRGGDRQKFEIDLIDRRVFYLAGLYRMGREESEFVVLTQPPVARIEPIHNRMPLLLDTPEALAKWFSGGKPLFSNDAGLRVAASGPEQLQMQF